MRKNLDYCFRTSEIRASMAQRKKNINMGMEKAKNLLLDLGFPANAIQTRVHIKKQGIARDIVEESQLGYDALVMGRKGQSAVKDFFVNSLPVRLLGKIRNIPLIVVGKKPAHKNILIAFDGTRAITKAVKSLSSMINIQDCKLLLCYSQHRSRLLSNQKKSSEMFDLSVAYLLEAGFSEDQVSFEIVEGEKNPTLCILNKARYGGYGTIVIGRRGLSTLKRLFLMRVGNRIFRHAENHVVWVVQ
ncbi:universal stress protein [Desulfobacter hydrogenophilus]|nr:universal stress protein [Desulfobacter hydrogenophilus]NDY74042.1 universal stress protein [Desulfobacter hydrogenophilus]